METQSGIVELSASGSGGKSIFHSAAVSPDEGPQVFVKDGQVFANSRDVAEYFGKGHNDLLKAIDTLARDGTEWGMGNFTQTYHTHPQNGQNYRSYDMTKDGFTELVMGFTGDKARQFKRAYIMRFKEMEATLKSRPQFSLPQTYSDALRALADKHERVQVLESEVSEVTEIKEQLHEQVVELDTELAEAKDDVEFVDKYSKSEGSKCFRDAAKLFGMKPKAFTERLGGIAAQIQFKSRQSPLTFNW